MRGVGQTQNMIDNLPNERLVIVTPSVQLGKEIKNRIEEYRGKELTKKIKFVCIASYSDNSKLFGLSVPIFFDHSFFDACDEGTAKEALDLAHGASVVYHHKKGNLI